MVYRTLCGDQVSLLGFGFLRIPQTSGHIDYDELHNMVDYAVTKGVNYFETAYAYMDGLSEIALGRALARHDREKLFISTKVMLNRVYSYDELEQIFNTQLNRMNTSYIDNYLFHNVNRSNWEYYRESNMYNFLRKKRDAGAIRHIGFSFHDTPELLQEVVDTYEWDFVQLQLNYLDWSMQRGEEQYNICTKKNLPIVVMEPIRGGELARLPEAVEQVLIPGAKASTTVSHALRWVASLPNVSCVLSGMSEVAHVVDNVKIIREFSPITSSEQANIDDAVKLYLSMGVVPCTNCGYCVPECPKKIYIPSVLTALNAFGRADIAIVAGMAGMVGMAAACVKCNLCLKFCPQHINIPQELERLLVLVHVRKPFLTRLREFMERFVPSFVVERLAKILKKVLKLPI